MIRPLRIASQLLYAALLSGMFPLPSMPRAHAAGAAITAYQEVNVEAAGNLSGTLKMSAPLNSTSILPITKDPETCGEHRQIGKSLSKGDPLTGAMVYLADIRFGKPFRKDLASVTVDQKECRFLTSGTVLGQDAILQVRNLDPVTHNIHIGEVIGRGYRLMHNVGQHPGGSDLGLPIRVRRGNAIRLTCGIHDFMELYFFVAKNPYYASVDETGAFLIPDIPPGRYRLGIWHPMIGSSYRPVAITSDQTLNLELAVP